MAVKTGALIIFTILVSVTTNTYSLDLFDAKVKPKKIESNSEHLITDASNSDSQFLNNDRWIHKDIKPQEKSSFSYAPWFLPWKTKRDYETWPKRRFPTPLRDQIPSMRAAVSPLSASLIRKTRGRQYDVPQIGKSSNNIITLNQFQFLLFFVNIILPFK